MTLNKYMYLFIGVIYWWDNNLMFIRIATGVDLFLISLPLLFTLYMYFNIPSFYDYFSVHRLIFYKI